MRKVCGTIGLLSFIVLLFLGISCGSSSKPGWKSLGGTGEPAPGRASDGQIAVYKGVPYVAFSDGDNGSKLTVMKFDGKNWVTVGSAGFSAGYVNTSHMSICLDSSNGTPYVAFDDSGADIRVMKFNGTTWVDVGTLSSFSPYSQITLAVSSGTVYLAFTDYYGAHVMSFTTTWAELVGLSSSYTYYMAFTLFGGIPYVAINDDTNNRISLMQYVSGWSEVAHTDSGITIDETWDPSLTESNGSLYLSFYNSTHGAVMMKLNGTTLESIGTLGSISNGDYIEYVSGTVSDGVPYVAFDDENRDSDPEPKAAVVMYYHNSAWTLFQGYPSPNDIESTLLIVDPSNGNLYLTYEDVNTGNMTVQVH